MVPSSSTRIGRRGRLRRGPRTGERAAGGVSSEVPAAGGRRRQGGAPQDTTLYTCSCGYSFQAPVSTSVGCPRCGRTQAW
jgi:hypothetical protein